MIAFLLVGACTSKLPTARLDVGGNAVSAEIAHTLAARQQGLMHRDSMAENSGMLFMYKDSKEREFWMKDTRLPLTIAYADSLGKIVRLVDMQPFDLSHTQSLAPAKYALEMNQGWFERHNVEVGDRIKGIPKDLDVE